MSIITSPPIGFPDDQQQAQWQSGVLIDDSTAYAGGGFKNLTLMAVANWQALQFAVITLSASMQVNVTWLSAPSGGVIMGFKNFVLNNNTQSSVITLTNMGPYAQVQVVNAGTAQTIRVVITATNRTSTPFGIFQLPILDVFNVTINATTSMTFNANRLYAGPAYLAFDRAVSPFGVKLIGTDNTGVAHVLYNYDVGTGSLAANSQSPVILPPLPVSAIITNESAGAGTFDFSLVGDSTR